jgi:hypothetical protein
MLIAYASKGEITFWLSKNTPCRGSKVSGFWGVLLFLCLSISISQAGVVAGAWNWMSRDFEVLMQTHGQINFAPYVYSQTTKEGYFPGYRSDFFTYVDFFSFKGFVSNWLIANTTLIERPDSTIFRLDKIRYTLTPGYRYEFEKWLISGLLLHECIHTVSRNEDKGSIWWNSFQIGFGSKGAYPRYLVEKYQRPHFNLRNSLDAQINFGAFLYGKESVWLAQNHNYRYEEFSLIRYHLVRWGRWGTFLDLPQHLWINSDYEFKQKISPTLNLFLLGKVNIASIFCTYHIYDNSTYDNESGLGLFGFKIIF